MWISLWRTWYRSITSLWWPWVLSQKSGQFRSEKNKFNCTIKMIPQLQLKLFESFFLFFLIADLCHFMSDGSNTFLGYTKPPRHCLLFNGKMYPTSVSAKSVKKNSAKFDLKHKLTFLSLEIPACNPSNTELPCLSTGSEVLTHHDFFEEHFEMDLELMVAMYFVFHFLGFIFLWRKCNLKKRKDKML